MRPTFRRFNSGFNSESFEIAISERQVNPNCVKFFWRQLWLVQNNSQHLDKMIGFAYDSVVGEDQKVVFKIRRVISLYLQTDCIIHQLPRKVRMFGQLVLGQEKLMLHQRLRYADPVPPPRDPMIPNQHRSIGTSIRG